MSLVGIFFYKKYEKIFLEPGSKITLFLLQKIKRREQNIIKLPYSNRKTENRKGKDTDFVAGFLAEKRIRKKKL